MRRSYAGTIQARRKHKGHFWQRRFGAVATDERHLGAAIYVAQLRARASRGAGVGLAAIEHASAIAGGDDGVTAVPPVRDCFQGFADFLTSESEAELFDPFRSAECIGQPLGDARFPTRIERKTKRVLRPGKPGPKPQRFQRVFAL